MLYVIFHFILHTYIVKIIRVYVDNLPKPHINMFYIFKMKTKRGLCFIFCFVKYTKGGRGV